eukprot:TRINITY_DN2104_c0_g1_i4.p1 TRINITY_DN2104_c0_g1~~TRINITY_DN2104_c0_g1_i4.p1  ORF type:complete len:232 (-),score=61.82 TRINITY_DN2104_c0_g1_i4:206-901(-)
MLFSFFFCFLFFFFFQAEDGIRDHAQSRGLGDVYKRQDQTICKNLAQLQKEYEYLSLELNEKTNFLDENEKKLAELQALIQNYEHEIVAAEQVQAQIKLESEQNQDKYKFEVNNGKDLLQKLTTCQTNIKTKEVQEDDLRSTLELLQQKHYVLIDENKKVNAEIDRQLSLIQQLQYLNQDIQKEMMNFNEQDQKMRQLLNRSNEINEHINQNESKLAKSKAMISHLIKKEF